MIRYGSSSNSQDNWRINTEQEGKPLSFSQQLSLVKRVGSQGTAKSVLYRLGLLGLQSPDEKDEDKCVESTK